MKILCVKFFAVTFVVRRIYQLVDFKSFVEFGGVSVKGVTSYLSCMMFDVLKCCKY